MNTQERNREALIRHIADLDAVIRRRNEQIENQAHNARETQRALEEIARERDEARDAVSAAHHAIQEAREQFRAAEPRPLTPDAIEIALHDCMPKVALDRLSGTQMMRLAEDMHAALTEPPARPEGAERFDPVIDAAIRGHSDITSPSVVRAISDAIAAHLTDPTRKKA